MNSQKNYRSPLYILYVTIITCFGVLCQGIQMNQINATMNSLTQRLLIQENLSYYQVSIFTEYNYIYLQKKGLIQSSLTLGAAFGSFIIYFRIENTRRRFIFFFIDILTIIGCYLLTQNHLKLIILGRFLQGVSIGFNIPTTSVFLREMIPQQLYTQMSHFQSILQSLGGLIFYVSTFYVSESNLSLYRMPIVFSIYRILFFSLQYKYETIPFLIKQKNRTEAYLLINKFYKKEYSELIENEITQYVQQKPLRCGFAQLIQPIYRKRLLLAIVLNLIQQFSGINSIIFYSTMIFQIAFNKDIALLLNIILSILRFIVYFSQIYISTRFGRVQLIIFGLFICSVSNLAMAFISYQINGLLEYEGYPTKISLVFVVFIFMIGFWISMGSTLGIYTTEIIPDTGVAICIFTQWIGAWMVTFTFPILINIIGQWFCFLIYSIFSMLGLFIMIKYAIETKNLSPLQIELAFKINKKLE